MSVPAGRAGGSVCAGGSVSGRRLRLGRWLRLGRGGRLERRLRRLLGRRLERSCLRRAPRVTEDEVVGDDVVDREHVDDRDLLDDDGLLEHEPGPGAPDVGRGTPEAARRAQRVAAVAPHPWDAVLVDQDRGTGLEHGVDRRRHAAGEAVVRHARVGLEDHVREPGDESLDVADLDSLDPGPFARLVRVSKEELGQQALVADVQELGAAVEAGRCSPTRRASGPESRSGGRDRPGRNRSRSQPPG